VLRGTVSSVGHYAATPPDVLAVMANELQVQELLKSGPKFLVRVALLTNSKTPPGFAWSSSPGPPQAIEGGMTSGAAIIVESRRPICRVIPINLLCAP
jgi:HlyD family secretion protein